MIRPQPPISRMKRRKTVSVMPAIGASTVAGVMATPPICKHDATFASAGAARSAGIVVELMHRSSILKQSLRYCGRRSYRHAHERR